jgi:hypothetical protein
LSGIACCFRRSDDWREQLPGTRCQALNEAKSTAVRSRRRSRTRVMQRTTPRPRQLALPLRRAA